VAPGGPGPDGAAAAGGRGTRRRRTRKRLAIDPLERHAQLATGLPSPPTNRAFPGNQARLYWSNIAFAEYVGTTPRQIHRWRIQGLNWIAADRAATAVGKHPSELWGRDWWLIDEEDHDAQSA